MTIKSKLETIVLGTLVVGAAWLFVEAVALGTSLYCGARAKKHYDIVATTNLGNYDKRQNEQSLAEMYKRLGEHALKFSQQYGLTSNVKKLFTKEKHYVAKNNPS